MSSIFPDPEPDDDEIPIEDVTRFSLNDEPLDGDALGEDDFELAADDENRPGVVGMLGEYILLELIGSGGMGEVYRAEHRTMNREVALKVLSRHIAVRPDLLERFFSEIRAVAKLMHPNIVTAFDAGSVGETHYLVMELVEGEILSSKVRRDGPFSTNQAVSVLAQCARALAYAHEQGIVHRDIKPSNMMLTSDGVVKILDFGLARLGVPEDSKQSSNLFMGTPEYMSPEQIENADEVDERSDLYSLGATLFYLLTGKPMFTGEAMQIARAQLRQKPTPLFVARSDVDLRLDAVFQKLVAKAPADRYANASELLDNLDNLNLTAQSVSGQLQRGAYRLATDAPTSVAYDKSTLAKKSQLVAIDLGMLASTAAFYHPDLGPQVIVQGEGNAQHIRNMLWSSGDSIKIGADAVAMRQSEPENVFHSMQRWLGARQITRPFGGKTVAPEVILGAMLRQVVQNASNETDGSNSAIVTVPACYDQMHRRAIRDACKIAGVDLVQLLDKPLAAALSWLDVQSRLSNAGDAGHGVDAKLLVTHLGGSGLEASVVQVRGGTAMQLGTCGHWKLGIQRWQHLLTEYFSQQLREKTGKSIREDVAAATRLQRTIEMAMDRLTRTSKVDVRFDWHDASIRQTVTQDGLVKIAPDLVNGIQQAIQGACAMAKIDPGEIDYLLVAGSMMQMKSVQQVVLKTIPHDVQWSVLDKADFAKGAAVQAHHVSSLSKQGELDPSAVGCTAYDIALLAESTQSGGLKPRVMLEKATSIPTSLVRTLRPRRSDAKEMFPTLQLIESTSLGESSWLKLGRIKPTEAFPLREADDPLQLRMEIDENGILESSLLWPAGNLQRAIPPSSDPVLSDEQIANWREWLETVLLCSS